MYVKTLHLLLLAREYFAEEPRLFSEDEEEENTLKKILDIHSMLIQLRRYGFSFFTYHLSKG